MYAPEPCKSAPLNPTGSSLVHKTASAAPLQSRDPSGPEPLRALVARISLGGRSWLRHQDLREGSAPEALLFDDVQLQVLSQLGEWAAPRADRNRHRRQLVFVDEAKTCQRLGEVRAAVNQDRPFVVASLEVRDLRGQVPAEDLDRSPIRRLQGAGEDSLRLLVHRGGDRPVGRGPMRPHDLVAAATHRVDAGLLERAAVPLTRVVAEPLEHPFVGPVEAGGKTVEGHDHLENYFPIAHAGRDLPPRLNSSRIGGFEEQLHRLRLVLTPPGGGGVRAQREHPVSARLDPRTPASRTRPASTRSEGPRRRHATALRAE